MHEYTANEARSAIIRTGPNLALKSLGRQRPVPRPGPNDILIRVVASTVSAADHRMRARDLPPGIGLLAMPVVGLFRPRRRILGMNFAGTVAAVGNAVTRFAPGDDVIGMTCSAFGGHAELFALPQFSAIATRPADLGHEEALALVFGGHTISECIRRREIRPGDDVLVNGASGAVGSAAVQVAKHFGARVTADNARLLARLGADRVIDYRAEDFSAGSETYEICQTGRMEDGKPKGSRIATSPFSIVWAGGPSASLSRRQSRPFRVAPVMG